MYHQTALQPPQTWIPYHSTSSHTHSAYMLPPMARPYYLYQTRDAAGHQAIPSAKFHDVDMASVPHHVLPSIYQHTAPTMSYRSSMPSGMPIVKSEESGQSGKLCRDGNELDYFAQIALSHARMHGLPPHLHTPYFDSGTWTALVCNLYSSISSGFILIMEAFGTPLTIALRPCFSFQVLNLIARAPVTPRARFLMKVLL